MLIPERSLHAHWNIFWREREENKVWLKGTWENAKGNEANGDRPLRIWLCLMHEEREKKERKKERNKFSFEVWRRRARHQPLLVARLFKFSPTWILFAVPNPSLLSRDRTRFYFHTFSSYRHLFFQTSPFLFLSLNFLVFTTYTAINSSLPLLQQPI